MTQAPRLSRIVEGVEFLVEEHGALIRSLVLRDALEAYFGADDSPDSWLRAYEMHRDTIDRAAADRYRGAPKPGIVILSLNQADLFRVGHKRPSAHVNSANARV